MNDSERRDNYRPPVLPIFSNSFVSLDTNHWPDIRREAVLDGILKDNPVEEEVVTPPRPARSLPTQPYIIPPQPLGPVPVILPLSGEGRQTPLAAMEVERVD